MPGLPNSSGISEEQLQSLRQAFALFDKDDSGSIDASELKACLRAMGHYPTPMELEDLMRRMDTDGNGEIDFDEFVKAMVHKFEDEDMEKELEDLKSLFMMLDKDNNGELSASELARAMETIGVTLSQAEAQFLVNEIDADGNGQVSFEEFAAYVLAFDEHDDHH